MPESDVMQYDGNGAALHSPDSTWPFPQSCAETCAPPTAEAVAPGSLQPLSVPDEVLAEPDFIPQSVEFRAELGVTEPPPSAHPLESDDPPAPVEEIVENSDSDSPRLDELEPVPLQELDSAANIDASDPHVEPEFTADPNVVFDPPVAAPIFNPVFTTDLRRPMLGVTLADDPQIQITVPDPQPSKFRYWLTEGLLLGRDFFFAGVVALFIIFYVIQPVKVEGTSMLPRLHNNERIFVNRYIYEFQSIQRGDIVVFWYPKDPTKSFIKRVIGIPGDEVQLIGGKLRINGRPVEERYLSRQYTQLPGPSHTWIVEPHHYFVMGDNRDASNDSRSWGLVPEKYIYGKAVYRYWPPDQAGSLSDDDVEELKKPEVQIPDPE